MLRSTLYRSSVLLSHRSGAVSRNAPRCTIPILVRRPISSGNDKQQDGSSTSESTRAPAPFVRSDTSSVEGNAAPHISDLDGSSTQEVHSSASNTGGEQTTSDVGTDRTKPADKQPPLASVIDVEEVKDRLRSWTEGAALTVRDKADRYTAVAATTFAQLGRELNKVTGYGEIESLKRQVVDQELRIKAAREAAHEAKVAYEQAVQQRASSQREVNDLLQRKSSWTDDDVGRFTALVRQDHLYEQAETRAKIRAVETEELVDREFTELMRVILHRYHEEQVWSDKIRSASTYGSLTVLGLNMLVFILAIIIVEPWKRKRLAQTFEKKVEELSGETVAVFKATHAGVVDQLKEHDQMLSQLVEALNHPLLPSPSPAMAEVKVEDSSELPVPKHVLQKPFPMWTVAASASLAAAVGWFFGARFA